MERIKGKAADFIAIAWFGLGFRPRESLVLIGMHGRVSGPVMRVDLPPREVLGEVVSGALAHLPGGVDGVFVLVVTDRGRRCARTVSRVVQGEAARAGLAVQEILHVAASSYRSLLCSDQSCCPARGHDLADVLASQAAAEFVLSGDMVCNREEDLLRDIEPVALAGSSGRAEAATAPVSAREWFSRWQELLDGCRPGSRAGDPSGGGEACGGGDPYGGWGALAAPFALALSNLALRDAVLASVAGEDEMAQAFLDRRDWSGPMFEGHPDEARMERARELLAGSARNAPLGARADALAVLAWMAWYRGDAGARARLLAARALAERPGHRLATIVDDLLTCSVPPGWWKPPVSVSETRYPPTGR